jgi:hypothetical protein
LHEYNFRVDSPGCFLLLDNRGDSVFRYPVFPEGRDTTAKVSDIAPGFATSANIDRAGNQFSKYLSDNFNHASNPFQGILIAGGERRINSKRWRDLSNPGLSSSLTIVRPKKTLINGKYRK